MKRHIPRMAAVSLVLGGTTSCKNRGGPTVATISQTFCEGLLACDATYFYSFYTSLSDCEDGYGAELGGEVDEARADYGDACARAILDYAHCFAALYQSSCDLAQAYAACEDEYEHAYELCSD